MLLIFVTWLSLYLQDTEVVVGKYKSGFQPPGDIPFEDLSNANLPQSQNNGQTPKNPPRTDSMRNTVSGGKGKKRAGFFGIFSGAKVSYKIFFGGSEILSQLKNILLVIRPAPMAHSVQLETVSKCWVRIPAWSDVCHRGCAYIQYSKLFKGLECTMLAVVLCTIKNPWKSFDKSRAYS